MNSLLPWTISCCLAALAIYLVYERGSPDDSPRPPERIATVPPQNKSTESAPASAQREPTPPPEIPTHPGPKDAERLQQPAPVLTPTKCPPVKACPPCQPTDHSNCSEAAELRTCQARVAQCESWDPIITESVRRESILSSRRGTLSCLLQDDLGLTDEQIQWIGEAACALRELRWHAVELLHQDGVETDSPRQLIMADRKEILADMQKLLGSPTYSRLRGMGGIGLLNDTLECADVPTGR